MTDRVQPFIILAETENGLRQQTRRHAASAMCLADDWADAGYGNVRIVSPDGVTHTRQQFRAKLPLVKKSRRRTLALT